MVENNKSSETQIKQKSLDFVKTIMSLAFIVSFMGFAIFLTWNLSMFFINRVVLVFGYVESLYKSGDLPLPLILSIVTASATITTAVVTTIITKNNDLRLQIRSEQRDKKALIYEELTEFFFKIIFSSKTKDKKEIEDVEAQEKEIVKFLTDYTPKIIMWGSDEVLREFYLFRSRSLDTASDPKKVYEVIQKFEELLFSIRKDLGHKNRKLRKGNILGLFVNDVENLL